MKDQTLKFQKQNRKHLNPGLVSRGPESGWNRAMNQLVLNREVTKMWRVGALVALATLGNHPKVYKNDHKEI